MTNPRTRARIEARIRERVAYCVEFELNDPRAAFITVTGVEVSSDLGLAKVFYSVYGTRAERSKAAHMLEDATGFVRRQIGRVLRTRRIPRLLWVYDDSAEVQEQVERAIQEALERDRRVNPRAHDDLVSEETEARPADEVEREYLEFLQAQEDEEPDGA